MITPLPALNPNLDSGQSELGRDQVAKAEAPWILFVPVQLLFILIPAKSFRLPSQIYAR